MGLVGPDGAGKTTTMRLLCGALEPSSGEAYIDGFSIISQTEQARALIGYLPQRFSLYDELTVFENLRFFAEVRGLTQETWRPRCDEILDFVGLFDFRDRRAGKLSGGMRQKLGLAAALVHRPPILLLDEPTTGVDPVTRQDFWQLIFHLVSTEDVSVFISTPYMDEATRCTRLGFLRNGRLLIDGPPDVLIAPLRDRLVELRGSPMHLLREIAAEDDNVEAVWAFGDRLHIRVRLGTNRKVITHLRKQVRARGGHIQRAASIAPQLEDVFLNLLEMES